MSTPSFDNGYYSVWLHNKASSTCKNFETFLEAHHYAQELLSEYPNISSKDILIEYYALLTFADIGG